MIKTYGLTHIQLSVRDLEKSMRFYQQLLGMEELFRFGPTAVMLQTPGTNEIITLNSAPGSMESSGTMGGIAHFGFRLCDPVDMAAVLEEMAVAGGTPIEHGKRGPQKEELYAFGKDPDGYEIEFFWAPNAMNSKT